MIHHIYRIYKLSQYFFLCIVFSSSLQTMAYDNLPDGAKVSEIELIGLRIVDKNYVLSLIESGIGEKITPQIIAYDIRNIFSQGFASDIKVELEAVGEIDYIVKFVIQEKPWINSIRFEGLTSFSESKFSDLKTKRYALLKDADLLQDVTMISEAYKRDKFHNVKVFYDLNNRPDGSVDVVFKIIENPRIYLTEINITGSKFFYALHLKRLFNSQEIDCFSWINGSGIFDHRILNNDLRVIYNEYAEHGFIKPTIYRPRMRIFNKKSVSKVVVDLYVEDGEQYRVNEIKISPAFGETLLQDEKTFLENFKLKSGKLFKQSSFTSDRNQLEFFYVDRGYAMTNIKVDTAVNDENKTIDLLYTVEHKEKVYINRMNIKGNQDTLDYVIRRELTVHDSQLFRSSKLQESRSALLSLGYFDNQTGINFEKRENENNTVDYDLTVKEILPGRFNFALTYSGQSNFGFMLKFQRDNLFGKGWRGSLDAQYYGDQDISISSEFLEPYLFDYNLSSTSKIEFSRLANYDSSNALTYRLDSIYLSESLGTNIWKNWRFYYGIFTGFNYYRDVTAEGAESLNFYIPGHERGISLDLVYSSVNHPVFSSSGLRFSLSYKLYGIILGGSATFNSLSADLQFFKSLDQQEKFVFMAHYRFKTLLRIGNNIIPPSYRLAIGGPMTLRGFNRGSINGASSPSEVSADFVVLDLKASDPASYRQYKIQENGNIMSLLNLELLFPLTSDSSYVRGVFFYDIGNVWSEKSVYNITGAKLDYLYYRQSFGGGVRIITPAGVVRIEYARVINPIKSQSRPERSERDGRIEFSIGGLF